MEAVTPDFGLSELLVGGLTGLGLGEGTAAAAGPIAAGALEGAGVGAGVSGITGGNPLTGALTGGITGGAIPAIGPALGEATGIGTTAGDALAGAGVGAGVSALTGGSPLTGALTGGAGGLATGAFGSSPTSTSTTPSITSLPTTGTGGGTSAASTASVAPLGGAPVDLTSFSGVGDTFGVSTGSTAPSVGGPIFGGPSAGTTMPASVSATPGGSGIGDKLLGVFEKNPVGALGIAGLGAQLLMGPAAPGAAEKQLIQQAGEAGTVGRTLEAYQLSGTLPAGLQAVVDQQFEGARAAAENEFTKLGLTDSTMRNDKLNQLKQQKSAEIAQFADNLAKQGINWQQLSSGDLQNLIKAQETRDAQFQTALGNFARGLAGGGFNIGQNTNTTTTSTTTL